MDEFKKNAVLLRTLLLFMSTYLYICSMYVRIKRKYDEGIENDKEKENGEHAIDDPLREDAGRMNGFQKKKEEKTKAVNATQLVSSFSSPNYLPPAGQRHSQRERYEKRD